MIDALNRLAHDDNPGMEDNTEDTNGSLPENTARDPSIGARHDAVRITHLLGLAPTE
jgi:hypothetical protein